MNAKREYTRLVVVCCAILLAGAVALGLWYHAQPTPAQRQWDALTQVRLELCLSQATDYDSIFECEREKEMRMGNRP